MRKAVECPSEARLDWKIIHELSRRMGKPMPDYHNESEIFDEIARVTPIMAGISYSRLEQGSIQWPCPDKNHPGTPTLYLERFNTPSGRGKLFPVDYVPQSEKIDGEYPMILNSGRILYHYHTATMTRRTRTLRDFVNKAYVLIHPCDALRYGLTDGIKVKIESRRGELETIVRISDEVLEGEVFMPWHFNESQVNRLTRDELDPYSRIAPFKLSAVRISRL